MANVSALIGSGLKVPTTSIASLCCENNTGAVISSTAMLNAPGKAVTSGALTANTYKELLSISGSGTLFSATVSDLPGGTPTLGMKIVIDGNTVLDRSVTVTAAAGWGVGVAYGTGTGYTIPATFVIPFKTSLSISVKSSASATDYVMLKYAVSY